MCAVFKKNPYRTSAVRRTSSYGIREHRAFRALEDTSIPCSSTPGNIRRAPRPARDCQAGGGKWGNAGADRASSNGKQTGCPKSAFESSNPPNSYADLQWRQRQCSAWGRNTLAGSRRSSPPGTPTASFESSGRARGDSRDSLPKKEIRLPAEESDTRLPRSTRTNPQKLAWESADCRGFGMRRAGSRPPELSRSRGIVQGNPD